MTMRLHGSALPQIAGRDRVDDAVLGLLHDRRGQVLVAKPAAYRRAGRFSAIFASQGTRLLRCARNDNSEDVIARSAATKQSRRCEPRRIKPWKYIGREELDVIVVGAGNAATCAACRRARTAPRVLMLEIAPEEARGGNSAFTGGAFRVVYHGFDDLARLIPDMNDTRAQRMSMSAPTPRSSISTIWAG